MAVYTPVPADVLATFLRPYALGPLRSAKGVAEGVENSTFLIQTGDDRFVLTLYEMRVAADDLPYFVALADHLQGGEVPVPCVLRTEEGEAIRSLCGRPACLYRYHPGLWSAAPTPGQAQAAGEALGRLHDRLTSFPQERPNALGPASWRAMADRLAGRLDSIEPGLEATVRAALVRLERDWPDDLPRGPIHADLFPDNVLMLNDRVTGVIDWTFACTDLSAYDLAIAHGAWAFTDDGRSCDSAVGTALVGGFSSVRPLSDRERAALPILAQGAALRFLLTRAQDWLHTPADALVRRKDPVSYRRRLDHYADPANEGHWSG